MGLSTHTQESFKTLKERLEATALRLVTSCQDAQSMIMQFTDEELVHLEKMLHEQKRNIILELLERGYYDAIG